MLSGKVKRPGVDVYISLLPEELLGVNEAFGVFSAAQETMITSDKTCQHSQFLSGNTKTKRILTLDFPGPNLIITQR